MTKHGEELRSRARRLRLEGWSVPAIAAEIGIARSTAFEWTKHIPREGTPEAIEYRKKRSKQMTDARWAPHRAARAAAREEILTNAADSVGELTEREIMLLGAAVYWCEGAKAKPWRPHDWGVKFVNSDVTLISLFLRFADELGYPRDQLSYSLSIHESADVEAAQRWWEQQIGLVPGSITKAAIKRHNPVTVRNNVGDHYHGCLMVYVPRPRRLYWRMEGIMSGVARALS